MRTCAYLAGGMNPVFIIIVVKLVALYKTDWLTVPGI